MGSVERLREVAQPGGAASEADAAVMIVADDAVAAHELLAVLESRSPGTYAWVGDLADLGDPTQAERPRTVVLSSRSLAATQKRLAALRRSPSSRVIVIATEASPAQVRELFDAGVDGLVLERDAKDALVPTLEAVAAGQLVLPRSRRGHVARPVLSTREKQVLGLVVLGFSNQDVAAKLHVAEATVKSHLTSSFRKLGVRSRTAAAARILDPQDGLGVGILSLAGADSGLDVFAEV